MADHREAAMPFGNQSRRSFMAASAAVLAGASVAVGQRKIPARVKAGVVRVPRRDETVRLGVIGTGGMGTGHIHAFVNFAQQGLEKVEVVALADVCDLRMENGQQKCDGVQSEKVTLYRDYRELLKRDDIHGVVIGSPEHWHAQHAIDAIVAGKDVYCEKPMTLDIEDGLALRKVVLAHPDRMFQVGTQMMQLPRYKAARQMIADGRIGKPVFSQTSYCRNSKQGEWLYYAIDQRWEPGKNLDWKAWCGPNGYIEWDPHVYARWRRYRKWSTGIIGDLLVHQVTPLMMALDAGWPTRLVASGGHYVDKAMENHDQVNINMEFESEHTMIVAGSTANEQGLETMIRGHRGTIYLGGRNCVMRPERIYADEVEPETVEVEDIGNDQDVHRRDWLRAIRTREHPLSGVDLGTKVMVMVDLATRSMWDGHAYRFNPGTLTVERV